VLIAKSVASGPLRCQQLQKPNACLMQSARFPPSILLALETWWRFGDMEPTKDQSPLPPHSRPTSSFDGLLDLPAEWGPTRRRGRSNNSSTGHDCWRSNFLIIFCHQTSSWQRHLPQGCYCYRCTRYSATSICFKKKTLADGWIRAADIHDLRPVLYSRNSSCHGDRDGFARSGGFIIPRTRGNAGYTDKLSQRAWNHQNENKQFHCSGVGTALFHSGRKEQKRRIRLNSGRPEHHMRVR
jgi:hypothetical protein